MAYNLQLADRIREHLAKYPQLLVEEKEMFRGLAFKVNGKMCINVSDEKLMCRFDPALQETLAEKPGFEPMIMKGKEVNGYCYVNSAGWRTQKEFTYWVERCLAFNEKAKASKKKKQTSKSKV